MPKHSLTFLPQNRTVEAPEGKTVLEAARENHFFINAPCGGRALCGGCMVQLQGKNLPPAGPEERHHLTVRQIEEGFRLACQLRVDADLTVRLLQIGEVPRAKIDLIEVENAGVAPDSRLRKVAFQPVEPTLENLVVPLREACLGALPPGTAGSALPLELVERFAGIVRGGARTLTLLVDGDCLAGVEPGDTRGQIIGAAVDIGTTTLALYLCDLSAGTILAASGRANSQSAYGDDVMSRISYCFEEAGGREQLKQSVRRDLAGLALEACRTAQVSPDQIYRWVLAGNTTMQHLFLGLDPAPLGHSPYLPVVNGAVEFSPDSLGLPASRFARGIFLPTVAGHVGADTVGVALAARLDTCDDLTLAVDLGTNGEIVLAEKGRLLCCSTAAGPAFEGARINMGMRAESGALDSFRVLEDGRPELHVIGGRSHPRGICGSGLMDLVSELLRCGIIDRTGRILPRAELPGPVPPDLARRVSADSLGRGLFLIDEYEENGQALKIILDQKDVRELQLAAGAISSGIGILLSLAGRAPADIRRVLLTGAFGNFLNPASALGVGLIRGVGLDKLQSIGNAAGVGARFALFSEAELARAEAISRKMEFVELAAQPGWSEAFTDSMFFPGPDRSA
jgi:uncharacterized 2Fe-2S/4Fe-4S cluster protein (DUF4445 family)